MKISMFTQPVINLWAETHNVRDFCDAYWAKTENYDPLSKYLNIFATKWRLNFVKHQNHKLWWYELIWHINLRANNDSFDFCAHNSSSSESDNKRRDKAVLVFGNFVGSWTRFNFTILRMYSLWFIRFEIFHWLVYFYQVFFNGNDGICRW